MKTAVDLSKLNQKIIETFEEVKEVVQKNENRSRGGLMLGLQEIGASLDGFIGAYYPVASNIIIVNKTPLRRILETNKTLLKPYIFHVLLHEYIHALGFLDEEITGKMAYDICKQQFGKRHIITQLSTDIRKFFPNLVYPIHGWLPQKRIPPIELVQGFDFSSTNPYIT
jgi:predicted Zn-dependent protease with MMP-like domain